MSEEKPVPRDFVYIGRRAGQDRPYVDCVIWLNDDGSLGQRQAYSFSRRRRGWTVGGIYRGASMSADGDKAFNVAEALYHGAWADRAARIEWEAEQAEIDVKLESEKLRKQHKPEVERQLRELRITYQKLMRSNYNAAAALETLVLSILRKPL